MFRWESFSLTEPVAEPGGLVMAEVVDGHFPVGGRFRMVDLETWFGSNLRNWPRVVSVVATARR
jgi:hypothetical protein